MFQGVERRIRIHIECLAKWDKIPVYWVCAVCQKLDRPIAEMQSLRWTASRRNSATTRGKQIHKQLLAGATGDNHANGPVVDHHSPRGLSVSPSPYLTDPGPM